MDPDNTVEPGMSRSRVRRIVTRASDLHRSGRPHEAWQTLADAGLGAYYPDFLRVGLTSARRTFVAAMTEASRPQ